MTTMTGAGVRPTVFSGLTALFDAVEGFLRTWRENAARRAAWTRTRLELEALSDRDLEDLGIARWDIDRVAREAVYGA